MNLVVNFLSTVVTDESNGNVKRMLNVCAEFERMAKVVLDKAEKDSQLRRKRKIAPGNTNQESQQITPEKDSEETPTSPQQPDTPTTTVPFPLAVSEASSGNTFHQIADAASPPTGSSIPTSNAGDPSIGIESMAEREQEFQNILNPNLGQSIFADQQSYPGNIMMGAHMPFQQTFVPQDLWQMPMTFEWDWAELASSGFPSFDNEEAFGELMRGGP
jgi:hypothetical protein